MAAGHCSKAASTNNPSRSSNTRESLSDHLKRKSNNVVRPTIGGISPYADLVEMEIKKMKIECHKRELEISILEHTQKMQAEQERKKAEKELVELEILKMQYQKEETAIYKQSLEVMVLEKQLNIQSRVAISLPFTTNTDAAVSLPITTNTNDAVTLSDTSISSNV